MANESGILVLAEHQNGALLSISTELLGAAKRLEAGTVTAVAFERRRRSHLYKICAAPESETVRGLIPSARAPAPESLR